MENQQSTITKMDREDPIQTITSKNFQENLLNLLKIPPQQRTEEQIKSMKDSISFLKFFQNLEFIDPINYDTLKEDSCSKFKYHKSNKGEPLMVYGEDPNSFFVLLKGKLGIYRPRPDADIQTELGLASWAVLQLHGSDKLTTRELMRLKDKIGEEHPFYLALDKYESISRQEVIYKQEYLERQLAGLNYSHFQGKKEEVGFYKLNKKKILRIALVNKLNEGAMLGELGMIRNRKRQATVIPIETCELSIMEKPDFEKIFRPVLAKEENTKRKFIEKFLLVEPEIFYLSGIICSMIEKVILPKRSIIYNQGDTLKKVWFVYSGEVLLSKRYKKKPPKISRRNLRKIRTETGIIDIHLEGRGSIIGEIGLRDSRFQMPFTVTVEREATLYYIDCAKMRAVMKEKKEISYFFKNRYPEQKKKMEQLGEEFEQKRQQIEEKMENCKIGNIDSLDRMMSKSSSLPNIKYRSGSNPEIKEDSSLRIRKEKFQKFKLLNIEKIPAPGVYEAVRKRQKDKEKRRQSFIDNMAFIYSRGDLQSIKKRKVKIHQNNSKKIEPSEYLNKVYNEAQMIIQRAMVGQVSQENIVKGERNGSESRLPSSTQFKNIFSRKNKTLENSNFEGNKKGDFLLVKELMKTDSSPLMMIRKRVQGGDSYRIGSGFNLSLCDKKSLIERESYQSQIYLKKNLNGGARKERLGKHLKIQSFIL